MPIGRQNSVEYALVSESQGRVVIPEPINFDDGNGNIYERDKDSKGFLKTKTNDLEYYGEGYDFLLTQYATKGIAEDVIQQRRIKSDDRLDERWRTVSETYLDMGEAEYDEKRLTVKTKSTQGGIYKQIESGASDEFDLTSSTSKTGDDIGAIDWVNIQLDGRHILLISELSVEDGTLIKAIVSGGDNLNARSIPFKVDINSDQEDITTVFGDKLNAASGNYSNINDADKTSNLWYTVADQTTKLILNGRVEIRIVNPQSGTLTLDIVRYSGGSDFTFSEKIQLDTANPGVNGDVASFDFIDYELEVQEGDSFAIGVLTNTSDGVWYEVYNTSLTVREDSIYPPTQCNALTEKAIGDRLIAKIIGEKDCLVSDLLDASEILITDGFRVRGFPDIVNEGTDEERKIQFNTSWDDYIKHLDTVHGGVAWWVEPSGDREVVRIESLKYTQQNFVGIKYAVDNVYIQASKIKRKNLKDNFYAKVEIGSDKGGEGYEEVFGLQSVAGKAVFTTINTNNDAVYEKVSPYALGDVDVELPRRKQFSEFPDEDTQYDSILCALDCKKINGVYYLKRWQDSYSAQPKNIYRPDSAFNLEFTPARLLLLHGFNINVGLYHYPIDTIKWQSSNCNSSFISQKVGEDELAEDGNISHTLLEKPRVKPKSVDFTLLVEQELEDQITGTTNGVPNWFGLVAVNTGQNIEYMRLVKVDTNKEGKHKLVEAFI